MSRLFSPAEEITSRIVKRPRVSLNRWNRARLGYYDLLGMQVMLSSLPEEPNFWGIEKRKIFREQGKDPLSLL